MYGESLLLLSLATLLIAPAAEALTVREHLVKWCTHDSTVAAGRCIGYLLAAEDALSGDRIGGSSSGDMIVVERNRAKRFPAFVVLAALAAVISGCAVQSQALGYRCEDGREFSVSISPSGETAYIEIARMRFGLVADPPAGSGEQFSCSMLTLRRRGNVASVEMDGSQQFSNCRIKR